MKTPWHTAWQGPDLVVFRDDAEVDRFAADQIERVVMVHRGAGDTPGDLAFALVELPQEYILLPADTGFAGRVHFERLNFWADKQCIYWVPESKAPLPSRLKRGLWLLRSSSPAFARLPKGELTSVVERWPVVGPQTWEQRKWLRIARSRPFGSATEPGALDAAPAAAVPPSSSRRQA
jgi:hypothetical protein